MERRISPFAALTGAEKQLKWLEYQSIRLPYVNENMDALPEESERQTDTKPSAPSKSAEMREPPPQEPNRAPKQRSASMSEVHNRRPAADASPQQARLASAAEFQKTRHHQYDAVIEKMRQAGLRASQYQPLH